MDSRNRESASMIGLGSFDQVKLDFSACPFSKREVIFESLVGLG